MAGALILEFSGVGPDKYREVNEALGGAGVPERSRAEWLVLEGHHVS